MSLFDQMGATNPQQLMQQLRANPAQILRQRGLNIPNGMTSPQQIVQHLVQSGQIPNARLQQVMQMVGRR